MVAKLKVDQLETVDGTGIITVNNQLTAPSFAGDGSSLTALDATALTGNLPALSGASLTALNATNLTGTVPTASLGSGTAGVDSFLRGDGAWEAADGRGKVLQVVFATHSAESYTTSSGWTNVGLSASITPSSTSSKIFVIASFGTETHGGGACIAAYTIYHDGTTNLGDSGWGLGTQSGTGAASYYFSRALGTVSFLHSPGSVASEQYDLRHRKCEGSGGSKVGPGVKVITLMEIAG